MDRDLKIIDENASLKEEADFLAKQLFGSDVKKRNGFISRLFEIYYGAKGKDFLIIHNPGGWGTTKSEALLQWERSIVEGVDQTIERLGYTYSSTQYFRSNHGWREQVEDFKEQYKFFKFKAGILAAHLRFLTAHLNKTKIILIGVSQGAAFSNAVLQQLNGTNGIYSIELGIPFPYRKKRVLTSKTIALDSNGLMPDAMMEWNVPVILRTYLTAPFRWIKYKIKGKKVKFTYCINVPGHDYNWDYPEVQRNIEDFLYTNFGYKK